MCGNKGTVWVAPYAWRIDWLGTASPDATFWVGCGGSLCIKK